MAVTQLGMMPPVKITGLMQGLWVNEILKTALELKLFTALKPAPASAAQVAKKLSLDERATGLVLDCLVALELLSKSGGQYRLTDVASAYLVEDGDLFLGNFIQFRSVWTWQELTETVRTGKAQRHVNEQAEGEEFFVQLTSAIFPVSYSTAQTLAAQLKVGQTKNEVRVLDIAAGSGAWSLPFAQSNELVHVDALDFPPVLQVTKKFATKYGVDQQYSYLAGNWRDIGLQPNHYDYVILGHILHSEGKDASGELLQACHAALQPGGTLVIGEFFQDADRCGPLFPSLFAVNMLLATTDGCVFTVDELSGMLKQCGFKDAKRQSLPFWQDASPVMIARK
jgi:2-polyprenyl-3-methyl-5-hydroxy-6-metoxy-1,4-benzoquinol methylase